MDKYISLMREARDNLWRYFTDYPPAENAAYYSNYYNKETFEKSSDLSCIRDMYTLFSSLGEYESIGKPYSEKEKIADFISHNTALLCDLSNMRDSHVSYIQTEIQRCFMKQPPQNENWYLIHGNRLQAVQIPQGKIFVEFFPSKDTASYQYSSNLIRRQKEMTSGYIRSVRLDKIIGLIRYSLEEGYDISPLLEHYQEMKLPQVKELIHGIATGIDVSPYNNANLPVKEMREIRKEISKRKERFTMAHSKKRLFVDMDGTLAKWEDVPYFERLLEEGYFLERPPLQNVVDAVHILQQQHPDVEVFILSACLKESLYAEAEKNAWLDRYLPEIDSSHRLFPAFGEDKATAIEGGIQQNDFLLDDYSQNLFLFDPPATGIKLLNGINHTHESWNKSALSFHKNAQELANDVYAIMDYKIMIKDRKPQDPADTIKQSLNVGDIVLDSTGALCRISEVNPNLDMVCTAPLENAEDHAHKLNVDFKKVTAGYGWYDSKDISLLSHGKDLKKNENPIKRAAETKQGQESLIPDPDAGR